MIYDVVEKVDTIVVGYGNQPHNAHFDFMISHENEKMDINFKIEDDKSQNYPVADLRYSLNRFDGDIDGLASAIMSSVRKGYDLYQDEKIAFVFQNEQSLLNDIKLALEPHITMEIEIGNFSKEKGTIIGEFTVNGNPGTFEMTNDSFYVEAVNEKDAGLIERAADKIEDFVRDEMSKEKSHNKDFER